MGITVLSAAIATTLASMRTGGLPATLSITYASAKPSHPGMTYVENGQELVALLRRNGLSSGHAFRVQWAVSPQAPVAAVNDVSNALASAGLAGVPRFGGQNQPANIGAQAYTSGNDISFGAQPGQGLQAHELTHVVQQKSGPSGNQ